MERSKVRSSVRRLSTGIIALQGCAGVAGLFLDFWLWSGLEIILALL
jgi:hypothetical protein